MSVKRNIKKMALAAMLAAHFVMPARLACWAA